MRRLSPLSCLLLAACGSDPSGSSPSAGGAASGGTAGAGGTATGGTATGGTSAGGSSGGLGGASAGAGGASGSPAIDYAAATWQHHPLTIVDPIVNGSSFMVPSDGISPAYDASGQTLVTHYAQGFDDPSVRSIWRFDIATGQHTKHVLTGTPLAVNENFCVGEAYCQFLGFDPQSKRTLVLGPATTDAMFVDSNNVASTVPISGERPPASWIDHTHRFEWQGRNLWLYGALGPAEFSSSLYRYAVDSAEWTQVTGSLPPVAGNCLALDASSGTAFSVAGRTSSDGGNTVTPLGSLITIDTATGSATSAELPEELRSRRDGSCAFDSSSGLLYFFGGGVVVDSIDETDNQYFSDLWSYDPSSASWSHVKSGLFGGMLEDSGAGYSRFNVGVPEQPIFGINRGYLFHDPDNQELWLMGAVPTRVHEQLYSLAR